MSQGARSLPEPRFWLLASVLTSLAPASALAQPWEQGKAPADRAAQASAPLARVIVVGEKSGRDAVPPAGWTPPRENGSGSSLTHEPGQPLDAAWVQSQFDRAAAGGGLEPSSAIALVQLINRAFITAGFVNSGVLFGEPGADAANVLHLRLVHGSLASGSTSPPVTIEWAGKRSAGLSDGYVLDRFPSTRTQPLSAVQLERDFRLLDESPAIESITAALRPGARAGEATLHLIVDPADRFDFYTGVSNDRSPSVGGDHVFAGGLVRNLIGAGDVLTAEAGMTRGVKDAQLAYATPFLSPRLLLNLRGSFNNAAVVASALEPLDIRARDRNGELGLSYQLRQAPLMVRAGTKHWSSSESLSAGLFLLHRRQRSFLLGEPFSFAPGSVEGRTRYEALRLSGDYLRRNLNRVIALSLGATVGLDGTRSDVPGILNPKRRFGSFLGQLNVAQRLGNGFELRGRLTGQHSRGLLYSGLRLAIGGANSVRGFRESLYLVDRGVIGSAELARTFSLSSNGRRSKFDWGGFTAALFTDAAAFRNAAAPQPDRNAIASVGAALAWTPSSALRASVSYGHALTNVGSPSNKTLQDRGVHFRVIVHPSGIL